MFSSTDSDNRCRVLPEKQVCFVMRFYKGSAALRCAKACRFCGSQFTLSGRCCSNILAACTKTAGLGGSGGVLITYTLQPAPHPAKLRNKRIPVVYDFAAVSYWHEITAQTIILSHPATDLMIIHISRAKARI